MEGLKSSTSFSRPPLSGRRGVSTRFTRWPARFVPLKNVVRAKREMGGGRDYGGSSGGGVVDENMIVLRMRIRETMISERRHAVPSDWMEWEKKYYEHDYNEDVCEAVGLLQLFLMNTRPSLALGMVVIIALSVPISSFVVFVKVVEVAKGILSGFLLS